MKAPALHRFTVDDYYRMAEVGVLDPDARVELLEGEIWDLSPPARQPRLHCFNVNDYYRMAETGILDSDARVELLEGVIHDMSPIGPLHGGITKRLIRFFTLRAKGRWIVSAQDPLRLDAKSEPQPDLMLLKPAPNDYVTHHPAPDDVLLLIEIADSSLERDRENKLPIYARFGIMEVWIVNLSERAIEIYREPHPTGYGSTKILRFGDQASPAAFPDVTVDVAELLRE